MNLELPSTLLPFRLEKQYREYVWGGSRLRPDVVPTAEAWAIYETNLILDGAYAGKTLAEAAEICGTDLLGSKVTRRIGNRMPVLVKLLDCNQWLSLQVHPNDRQAQEMEGAGQFGKTEAWYFLDTDAGAEILCGVKSGIIPDAVKEAVRNGTILDCTKRVNVSKGEHVLIPAGTIHALGPGMLVYEVQESSDITYRVFDWNRPASQGRVLHIEQSVRVIDAGVQVEKRLPIDRPGVVKLLGCEYFQLEKITSRSEPISVDMDGTTFHALTAITGSAFVSGDGWEFSLHQFDSLVLPACTSGYSIDCKSDCEVLRVTA